MACQPGRIVTEEWRKYAENLKFVRRGARTLGPLVETTPRLRRLEWSVREWAYLEADGAEASVFNEREDRFHMVSPRRDVRELAVCVTRCEDLIARIDGGHFSADWDDLCERRAPILRGLADALDKLRAWKSRSEEEARDPKGPRKGGRPTRGYNETRRVMVALLEARIERTPQGAAERVARWVVASWRGYERIYRKTMDEIRREEIEEGRPPSPSLDWTGDIIERLWGGWSSPTVARKDPAEQVEALAKRFRADYAKSVRKQIAR